MPTQIQTQMPTQTPISKITNRNHVTIHDPSTKAIIELALKNIVASIKFVEVTARVEVCWISDKREKCRSYEGTYCNRSMHGEVEKIFEILSKVRELSTKDWLRYVTSTCKYCADLDTHIYLSLCRRHLSAYQVFDGARFFTGARLWQTNRGLVLELRRVTGCRMKTCECYLFENGNGVCYVYWNKKKFKFRSHGYPATYNYLVSKIKNDLLRAKELSDNELGPYTYRVEEKKGWLTGDWYPRTECDDSMLSMYDSF